MVLLSRPLLPCLPLAVAIFAAGFPCVAADLRGHGGPVRAIAIAGAEAATASFDASVIRWDLASGSARQVLRFHEGGVNALVILPDGGLASAGEDRRLAIWRAGSNAPSQVLEGHSGPIVALALSPDGREIASASWDGTVRVWSLASGEARVVEAHRGPVNAVLFLPDGSLASAGYDGIVWIEPKAGGQPVQREFGLPLNAMVRAGGELAVAGADGVLRLISHQGVLRREIEIANVPIVALAASDDGQMIAAAGFRGALAIVARDRGEIMRRMVGPAFPLWSLAFSRDGTEILTGGADHMVRRWKVQTGEPANAIVPENTDAVLRRLANHPGAAVFQACSACHSLGPDQASRAGPSLGNIMGRKIATAQGYDFSPALKKMDIVWTRETIALLFEIGPAAYTPGTKMPEQKIGNAADREALVDFLSEAGK